MAKGAVARRYARAVFGIAREKGELDAWLADLATIRDVLERPELAPLLRDPSVSPAEKRQTVRNSLPPLEQQRLNLVYLLIDRGRTDLIGDILEELGRMVNQVRGIEVAEVTTAVPLTKEQAEAVARRLGELTGKEVTLHRAVDPAIVGGIVARVGDKLIDGSVKSRLSLLRERLV